MRELRRLVVGLWVLIGAVFFAALIFADVKDPATIKTDATADLATNTEMFLQPTIDVIDSINIKYADNTAMEAGGTSMPNGTTVYLLGHTTTNDGGEGTFVLDTSATDVGAENDGTIFASAGGTDWYWRRALVDKTITPQMFGATGDGTTDDDVQVQAAADACDVLNTSSVVRPVLWFPPAVKYRCVSTITVKEFIHITMDAAIYHDGTESTTGLIVGTAATRNEGMRLHMRMERNGISDWTNEGSTGIKLINSDTCNIFAEVDTLAGAGGFTVGLQCMGSGLGFVNNSVHLGYIGNNKIGVDLTSETVNGSHTGSSGEATVLTDSTQSFVINSLVGDTITNLSDPNGGTGSTGTVTSNTATTITMSAGLSGGTDNDWDNGDLYTVGPAGWCNNNEYYGGRFFCFTATHVGTERYGFRLTGDDIPVSQKDLTGNIIFHPSIECRVDCLPILVVHGRVNRFFSCRSEDNGPIFAKVLHDDDVINEGNVFHIGLSTGAGTLVQQGSAAGNVLIQDTYAMAYSSAREVFDSGPMHENAVYYDGTQVNVPNVHINSGGATRGSVALASVTFNVSETCTFTNATNRVNDTAHPLSNGRRLFFSTGTLPAELDAITLYYVINATADDFQISTDPDGSVETFTDDGTPTNTYNSRDPYLTLGVARSVGVRVDATKTKNFIVTREAEVDNEGRIKVKAFNADEKQLQNEETFTVDIGTDEIIQANHTLVVDDRITFTTSAADLPEPLLIATDYFVISITVGRFKISTTEGGSAVPITDAGTGTHTYHLSYGYITGRPELFWNSATGGIYWQGNDSDFDQAINVRDEVASVDISIGRGTADAFLRRFKILTTDRHTIPSTSVTYGGLLQPKFKSSQAQATQAPTLGVYTKGQVIWNTSTPVAGGPLGWICTVAGAPGTWVPMSYTSLSGSTTFNPASLAVGVGETTSLTVTGAAVGDFVQVSAPYDLLDFTVTGYVQAADTVEIRLHNDTGIGPTDIGGSGTWRVKVTSP